MINLIPMAGHGSRFKLENYKLAKPLIPIMGKPMFITAINSLPPADNNIIICLSDFLKKHNFENTVSKYLENYKIISTDYATEGQACTCLLAKNHIRRNDSILITSCDYQVIYNQSEYLKLLDDKEIDVIVWTFRGIKFLMKNPMSYAYCRVENNKVTEIIEKKTISDKPENDHAVVGTFTFKKFSDFLFCSNEMIKKDIRINNEFYVGTSINQLIQSGKNVKVFDVNKFISFGTPFDLKLYQYWEEFFYNEKNTFKI